MKLNTALLLYVLCLLVGAVARVASGRVEENDGGLRIAVAVAAMVTGITLLVLGAEYLVRGAVRLARQLGVSPFFIGVTVVAFGTSAPELAASVGATLKGRGDLAVGNVLGSNIANICLILGVTALIRPIPVERTIARLDAPLMLVITALALPTMLDPLWGGAALIGRVDGLLLCAGLAAFVIYSAKTGKADPEQLETEVDIELGEHHERERGGRGRTLVSLALIAAGLVGLVFGADLLVEGASEIAEGFGVSTVVIGLTIVAVGTSLPELVFSARAATQGHSEIAIGNIVGSNVFNLLCVLGVAGVVRPVDVPPEAWGRDTWVVLGATGMCLVMMLSQLRISRAEGLLLLLAYGGYTTTTLVMANPRLPTPG